MKTIMLTLEALCFAWILLTSVYVFFYACLSFFYKQKRSKAIRKLPFIHIVVPAYKEDEVIYSTIQKLMDLDYPKTLYDVTVIADHFQPITISKLNNLNAHVFEVNFQESTKSNAIHFFLKARQLKGDCILLMDADNVMESQCIRELAYAYRQGHNVVQAHRTAKNTDTAFSIIDAISEEINNTLFCKAQQVIGFTSRLTGSGLLINTAIFKECMEDIHAVGGFDKELEIKILKANESIFYQPSAIIYDEKVNQQAVLNRQRTRWISAQLHYFKKYLLLPVYSLFSGKINLFNKSLQLFLLPKMFVLVLSIIGIALSLICDLNYQNWIIVLGMYFLAHVMVFPVKFWNPDTLKALLSVPKTLFSQVFLSHKLWNANRKFIHTPHNTNL